MNQQNKHVGCSGWYYKEWRGIFYPKTILPSQYFSFYTQFFNTVEVNSTFYQFPPSQMTEKWYKNSPENFKYTLKVNKLITHIRGLKGVHEEVEKFYELSHNLKNKIGCFLFQFPKSFVFNQANFDRLLSILNPGYENVVEFRHVSWWHEKVFDALSNINATFCTVSGLDLPEELIVLNGRSYIRFHGDPFYKSPYTKENLSTWHKTIYTSSSQNLWVYFNNTVLGHAPKNALMLKNMIEV